MWKLKSTVLGSGSEYWLESPHERNVIDIAKNAMYTILFWKNGMDLLLGFSKYKVSLNSKALFLDQ
ncbi:hypothetical protein FB2170_04480 [Maribacter sp. HTCC2170]|nr:hypothetical protein FB2170_04480 [Maribacter sp. HTCC2170]